MTPPRLFLSRLPGRIDPPAIGRRGSALLAPIAALGVACSVTPESYAVDGDRGSTQAVVAVARQESVDGASRADALAGFIRLPAAADRTVALDLAGLSVHLPEVGHCWQQEPQRVFPAVDEISSIEFLEAGRVRLVADGGAPHELAPHVFPSVGDLISGVLYASRERSGQSLPDAALYRLETEGGAVGSMELEHAAPEMPADVSVNGAPLESWGLLPASQHLDLIWSGSGEASDRLYVEVNSGRGPSSMVCTFDDAAGAGTLPSPGFAAGETAQLVVHRLRVAHVPISGDGVTQVELRFNFSVSHAVEFE